MTALIPTKEVARRKGVTVKTVNQWAKAGKLTAAQTEQVSGARLFDPVAVEKFNPLDPSTFVRALEDYTKDGDKK